MDNGQQTINKFDGQFWVGYGLNCPSNRCPCHCPSMSVRCLCKRQNPKFESLKKLAPNILFETSKIKCNTIHTHTHVLYTC